MDDSKEIKNLSLGELYKKIGFSLDVLAQLWGKKYTVTSGTELDDRYDLWLAKKGSGWSFIIIDRETNQEQKLQDCSAGRRIDAVANLPALKSSLDEKLDVRKSELQTSLSTLLKLINEGHSPI